MAYEGLLQTMFGSVADAADTVLSADESVSKVGG